MKAYRYKDNGEFDAEVDCQIDPLETELAGHEIYLLPGNSTYTKPLEEKEGFIVKWNKEEEVWEYEEKKKESEPEPYVPTEKDKLNEELWTYKAQLQESDYRALKFAEGWYTEEEYAPYKAERQELRNKINETQAKIDALED